MLGKITEDDVLSLSEKKNKKQCLYALIIFIKS